MLLRIGSVSVIVGLMLGCTNQTSPDVQGSMIPELPAHMPSVPFPADNPYSAEKAELGRYLFYDVRLSSEATIACASCHRQEAAFSDAPNQVSKGVYGARGQRNSPMIVNAAYNPYQFWDGRAATLEEQAMGAFLNSIEMAADTMAVATLLRGPDYRDRWLQAFHDSTVTMPLAMKAIATFVRTLVSANSPYDRYLRGERDAMTSVQLSGMRLFFSERTKCASCHNGPNLTNNLFQNVGLFSHYFDTGRYRVTGDHADEAMFKTPTLRNVELSPPYMAGGDSEDGEMLTLESVVEHYDKGGKPFGNKDTRVVALKLSNSEKASLVEFMKALTDRSVLTNPRFAKP